MTGGSISRRDFLKLGAAVVGGSLLNQKSKSLTGEFVKTVEIEAVKESLRVSLQQNLIIPEDWPGEKKRLMSNHDYKSPVDIFTDTLGKVRQAGVTPIFNEPKDGMDLTDEVSILLPVLNQITDVFIKNYNTTETKLLIADATSYLIDMSIRFRDVTKNPINDITDNVEKFTTLASYGCLNYSGISQRACRAAGIVGSSRIDENDEFNLQIEDGSVISNADLYTDEFNENNDRIPSERGTVFLNAVVNDLEDILNDVFQKRSDNDSPQDISDLISTTVARNGGDIISGLTDAMLVVKLIARNETKVSFDENNKICLTGSLRYRPSEENADFLATMFKDEFSLIAPTTELTQVHIDNPQYQIPGLSPNTYDGKQKDFQRKNRSGGLYHGLNEMLMYGFFRPELNSAIIISYYNILGSMKEWSLSNGDISFIEFLRESFDVRPHGLVKAFSDLAILLHGSDLYKKFRLLQM